MRENKFQAGLIKELKSRFPGCIVLKNDANYIQGIPDLLVLFKNMWAALECKASANSSLRPNQQFYIREMSNMSYAAIIFPENKEDILNELQKAFGFGGEARVS